MKPLIRLGLVVGALVPALSSSLQLHADSLSFDIPSGSVISNSGTPSLSFATSAAPGVTAVSAINLTISHEWLGDLTVKLVSPSGGEFILFDRVGHSTSDTQGSAAILGTFVPGSNPDDPEFDLVPLVYQFGAAGADLASEAATAAGGQGAPLIPSDKVYAAKTWPSGPFSPGAWQLIISDASDFSGGVITAAGLTYTKTVEPVDTLSLNWSNPADIVYGTALGSGQLNATATVGGSTVPGTFTYSPAAGTVLSAGTARTLSVTFVPQDTSTYSSRSASVRINVNRAPLAAVAESKIMTYGSPLPSLTASYGGLVNGDTPDTLTQPVTLSTPASSSSPVGSYPIAISGGSSPNYTITGIPATLTITKAPLTVTAENKSKSYGAPAPGLSATYNGFLNGDTTASLTQVPTLVTTANESSPVGTYPILVLGGDSPNYAFFQNNGTLTVTKTPLSVTAEDRSKAYGSPNPALTAVYTGFVNGDTAANLPQPIVLATTATVSSPVGSYPITIAGGDSPNYSFVTRNGTLTVTKAPLTIFANDESKEYGAPLPALTVSYNGFVNGDTEAALSTPVTVTTTATPTSPAGVYPITPTGGSSRNYSLVFANGQLTVSKAPLTVTAESKSKAFGAPLPALTVTFGGFVNGDTAASFTQPVTLVTAANANSPVGTYPIVAQGGVHPNYSLVFANGTLTVSKAILKVTADDQTKVYGADLPKLSASYSGFINGDTPESLTEPPILGTTATVRSPVGAYPISVSGGSSPNYSIQPQNGNLIVSKAALTVTAEDKTMTYGSAVPLLTAFYSGFVNGDTIANLIQPAVPATSANPQSPAGTYPITLSGGASPNYNLVPRNGALTVSKAILTASADDKSKAYGAALPALTVTFDGFVNGDTAASLVQPIALSTTATMGSPAGTYPITPAGGASPNYAIQVQPGTLTVTKATLAVTAENKSTIYGAAIPQFTAGYAGFVNGDTAANLVQPVTLTSVATSSSGAGTYPIIASGGNSPNYNLNLKNGVLTIGKAPLTITADSKSKAPGAPLPLLTASYKGFVNNDTASEFTQPARLVTTATAASPVGSYPIIAMGAQSDNYAISFVSGTLTVSAAAATPTFAPGSVRVAPDHSLIVSVAAPVGAKIRLESSEDLDEWLSLDTQTSTGQPLEFHIGRVNRTNWKFFRAGIVP